MSVPAIQIKGLCKTFRSGLRLKKFIALDNLDLEVLEGEILGYLGPNGAGKTTTFKLILDFIRPDSGDIYFWGNPARGAAGRREIGFLPENPYFYAYLTPLEALDFYGRLFSMKRSKRVRRSRELLKLVGLEHAVDLRLRKFSRGMLQRLGIAQALINDPRILILDEPMSGLDPMGRREMRDIILKCKDTGKTVIFSSHILSDVEMICDRAALLFNGHLQDVVRVDEVLEHEVQFYEVIYTGLTEEQSQTIEALGSLSSRSGGHHLLRVRDNEGAITVMEEIKKRGGKILAFTPHRESIEDIFVKKAEGRLNRWGR